MAKYEDPCLPHFTGAPPLLARVPEPSYHQTYNTSLPQPSIDILSSVMSGLVGISPRINAEVKSLHTIGIWREDTNTIYRCCFMQPDIATMTCSIPIGWKSTAEDALNIISSRFPDAPPCTIMTRQKLPQISGRMTPYVVEMLHNNMPKLCIYLLLRCLLINRLAALELCPCTLTVRANDHE